MRTVITRLLSISLFMLLLFNVCKAADEYCIPPFLDKWGDPYTGIVNVKFEGETTLDNSTPYDDKYKYFDELPPVELEKGKEYNLSITLLNTMQQSWAKLLQVRVWIDWNHDFDFDDEGEEVITVVEDSTNLFFEELLKVPEGAATGITRMRVYEDMVFGHIDANPCGYINEPKESIGHHGNVEDYDIKITGTGTPQPELTLSVDTLDFGGVVENQSDSLTFDISNTGSAALEITQISVGGTDKDYFSIQNINLPLTIEPGNSETITAIFSPTGIGNFLAGVGIVSNDTGGPGIVRLAGEGIAEPKPELTLSVQELDFGEIYNDQTKQLEFGINNSGNDTLMVAVLMVKGKDANAFSLSGFDLPLNIEAGDSVAIIVEFNPVDKGDFGAQIIIGSNATEEPITLVVTGKSLGPNSVLEDTNILSLSLTPNPASETINIKYDIKEGIYEEIHLYIVDLSGNKVKSLNQTREIAGGQNITADIMDLPAGKYFLIIESGGTYNNYPLIIVR